MPMKPKDMVKLLESNVKLRNIETNTTVILPMNSKELKKGTEHSILKTAGINQD